MAAVSASRAPPPQATDARLVETREERMRRGGADAALCAKGRRRCGEHERRPHTRRAVLADGPRGCLDRRFSACGRAFGGEKRRKSAISGDLTPQTTLQSRFCSLFGSFPTFRGSETRNGGKSGRIRRREGPKGLPRARWRSPRAPQCRRCTGRRVQTGSRRRGRGGRGRRGGGRRGHCARRRRR